MDIATLKKAAYITGIIVFFVILLGFIKANDYEIDDYLFHFDIKEYIPFSVLSLFAGALMIFGMKASDATTTMKRCKTGAVIGGILWLWIIVSLFVCNHYYGVYFFNWLLLCASATALIVFAIKFTLKKEE